MQKLKEIGYTVKSCCDYFGKSRAGYYDRLHYDNGHQQFKGEIIKHVNQVREILPKCGTRKLQQLLGEDSIKVGRDRLFRLLREENLLIKRKRRHMVTSDSDHSLSVYDNLLKEYEISHAEEVFVSDITYLRTAEGFCYLAIVADAYSKKIMGKFLSRDMHKTLVLKALVEALRNRQYNGRLIHHSDQGSQYCSKSYINALKFTDTLISMSGKGRAWENPYAERIIGILKGELGLKEKFETYDEACEAVETAILRYNTYRPHLSCGYLTPQQAHEKGKDLINCWKKKNAQKV